MNLGMTQYLLPDGHTRQACIEIDDDLYAKVDLIRGLGMRFTAEILTTGEVSFCAEHEEGDFLITVAPNGPGVREAIEKMVRGFDATEFGEWLADMTEHEEATVDA